MLETIPTTKQLEEQDKILDFGYEKGLFCYSYYEREKNKIAAQFEIYSGPISDLLSKISPSV